MRYVLHYDNIARLANIFAFPSQVLFVDADTLLFNDPWSINQSLPNGPYDLRYQAERNAKEECSGVSNGGQILVRRTNATKAYFANMKAHKAEILDGHHGLDQKFMIPAAIAAGAKHCSLDPTHFIGHCAGSRRKETDSEQIVVFHTNCVGGDVKLKLDRLLQFYKVVRDEQGLKLNVTVGQVDV
jgi:hypothetical protein